MASTLTGTRKHRHPLWWPIRRVGERRGAFLHAGLGSLHCNSPCPTSLSPFQPHQCQRSPHFGPLSSVHLLLDFQNVLQGPKLGWVGIIDSFDFLKGSIEGVISEEGWVEDAPPKTHIRIHKAPLIPPILRLGSGDAAFNGESTPLTVHLTGPQRPSCWGSALVDKQKSG